MKNRGRNVATRLARHRARKLRAHEALAELERARKLSLQSDKARGHPLNDDKSPLIDLMNCIICREVKYGQHQGSNTNGPAVPVITNLWRVATSSRTVARWLAHQRHRARSGPGNACENRRQPHRFSAPAWALHQNAA